MKLLRKSFKLGWINDNKHTTECRQTFKRILVLNKRTRYELEKAKKPGISDDQLENVIRKRGSNYDRIAKHHYQHTEFVKRIIDCFSTSNLEVETVNRTCYSEKEVAWADLIVVGGGDGTFLHGASKILDQNKPIVGFNTNPGHSEGYLCLPKKYSFDVNSAVVKILKNDFHWLMRNRLEVELEGTNVTDVAIVHDPSKNISIPEKEPEIINNGKRTKKVLSTLALNEVFMGENTASQTSCLSILPDGCVETLVKCSGLCVSTGTGSTSWLMSINRLTEGKVKKLLQISGHRAENLDEVAKITREYNSSLRFSPDDRRLFWSLREPIYSSVFPNPQGFPANGFSTSVNIGSRCLFGCLVIDGTHWYSFDDGTVARLYSTPDKCLRTIVLNE